MMEICKSKGCKYVHTLDRSSSRDEDSSVSEDRVVLWKFSPASTLSFCLSLSLSFLSHCLLL